MMICFGGSDPSNETKKALNALLGVCDESFTITVIVGSLYEQFDELHEISASHTNVQIIQQVSNIEYYLAECFLAIGAVGSMTWERCCMGLPSIVASIADNQLPVSHFLAEKGVHSYVGHFNEISIADYKSALLTLINNKESLTRQHRLSYQLVDGLGVKRVIESMATVSGKN